MRVRVLLLALLLGCCTETPVRAAEGRIPIFEPIDLDGNVEPIEGRYILVRNIEVTGPIIRVTGMGTERVEIDLNGFSIRRTDPGGVISIGTIKTLVLRNGSVVSNTAVGTVVSVTDTTTSGEVILQRLKISGGATGLLVDGVPNFQIQDNIVVNTGSHGMLLQGETDQQIGGVIERNVVKETTNFGIWIGADGTSKPFGVTVRGNRIEDVGIDGITIKKARGFTIENNTVSRAGWTGIKVQESTAGIVRGNVVFDCGVVQPTGTAGIRISNPPSNDCLVTDNTSSSNKGAGILIEGSGNQITGNVINRNETGGLVLLGDQNTFGRNTGRYNTGTPECLVAPIGECGTPNFCDSGAGNSSFEDNFMPGPC